MIIVCDRGSLGASGDPGSGQLFLPLIGWAMSIIKERSARLLCARRVRLNRETDEKRGLTLNGTQFMSANGVFAILKAFRLSKKADLDCRPFLGSLTGV